MSKREKNQCSDESRREFLRNSAYAACATPIVLSMLVRNRDAGEMIDPIHRFPNPTVEL